MEKVDHSLFDKGLEKAFFWAQIITLGALSAEINIVSSKKNPTCIHEVGIPILKTNTREDEEETIQSRIMSSIRYLVVQQRENVIIIFIF